MQYIKPDGDKTANNIHETTIINKDYLLFADDTALEFKDVNDIITKLTAYASESKDSNFPIIWKKYTYLQITKLKQIQNK